MDRERTQRSPTTLGDVLYAKSKAPVSKQDWTTLVQSIAAGDEYALHALHERAHHFDHANHGEPETAEELTIDALRLKSANLQEVFGHHGRSMTPPAS